VGARRPQVEAQQACYLPLSPDGVPVIGQVPGVRGAYVATGHSCWGILNAPATGLAVAELLATGEARSVDLRAFAPARFAGVAGAGRL
jgi:glycine/D-amino acid oxidase-like deaminating enzyme